MPPRKYREDHIGSHRTAFEKNKKRILASQNVCGICGKEVDMSLKFPHPLSATVDHIIPLARGGHPSALENLQLAHLCCNRMKADKLFEETKKENTLPPVIANNNLPLSRDWSKYRG